MEQKIKSITEAFSMQPNSFSVCNIPESFKHEHDIDCIVEILLEKKVIDDGGKYSNTYHVYRGFNKNGKMLFEYFANTVNVTYFIESEE
jgi:hypothetical protein